MFTTPSRRNGNASMLPKRPNTAYKNVKPKIDTHVSPSPQKQAAMQAAAGKKVQKMCVSHLIKKKDRLKAADLIAYLTEFLQAGQRIKDPNECIKVIFDKIQNWKAAYGDLDQQEKMIRDKFSNAEDKVDRHNIVTQMRVLQRIQEESQLTDDELYMICFTSMNSDYFTNLLIQAGEFTSWFNLNFAGESQEEIDFRHERAEEWDANLGLAAQIVEKYHQMIEAGYKKLEDITHKEWFEHLRFSKFGHALEETLTANPQLIEKIVGHFKEHKDKLSYYDFFKHVREDMKLELKGWEVDALESKLDKMGDAYIDLHEFAEFCDEYDVNLGIPLEENHNEDIIEQKNNISYRDYKLHKHDYFQGCKTMLTSEKAALAKCHAIYEFYMEKRALGSTTKYLDKDFGPMRKSDLDRCKFTLYKNGEMPKKGYPDPRDVEFVYVEELIDKKGVFPQFVDDGVASNDCKQGNLGDCWLISAMSTLAVRDELLIGGRRGMEYDENMIVDKMIAELLSKGVYPPIFHRYRSIGLYVIRLFIDLKWVYVIVDERIPIDSKTRLPCFGRCRNINEMWVSLIEKAFAKVYGCYENLISGYVDEGVCSLTAFPSEKIFLKDEKSGVFPHKQIQHYGGKEALWKLMMERDNESCLMGCNIKGSSNGALLIDGKDSGLIQNHAYSLNDVMELADPFNNGEPIRLLRLRNPWGKSEWLGAWSSDSEEMVKYKGVIQEYIN